MKDPEETLYNYEKKFSSPVKRVIGASEEQIAEVAELAIEEGRAVVLIESDSADENTDGDFRYILEGDKIPKGYSVADTYKKGGI